MESEQSVCAVMCESTPPVLVYNNLICADIHLSVHTPLWTFMLSFLPECNYSCVNMTEAPDAALHY